MANQAVTNLKRDVYQAIERGGGSISVGEGEQILRNHDVRQGYLVGMLDIGDGIDDNHFVNLVVQDGKVTGVNTKWDSGRNYL